MAFSWTSGTALGLAVELAVEEGEKGGARALFGIDAWSCRGQGTPGFAQGERGRSQGTRESGQGCAGTVVHSAPLSPPPPTPARCSTKWPQEINLNF